MRSKVAIAAALLVLFSGMCIIENSAEKCRPSEPKSAGSSSMYALAGEFRSVFANLLWIKCEQYHHEFIEKDPNWTQNTDMLGLLNMITALDPRFVEAYATGAYMYADGCKDKKKGLNYLLEGIRNNPKSTELNKLAAIMYARRFNDPKRALPYAEKSLQYADDDFTIKNAARMLRSIKKMAAEEHTSKKQTM